MTKRRKGRLKRRVTRSYLTATVSITLVLFLVGVMSLLLQNAERLAEYVREHVGFTLVLNDNVREPEVLRLQKVLSATSYVKHIEYVDKEAAAANLQEDLGEDFVGFLGFNPLSATFDVKLHAAYMQEDSLQVLEEKFLAFPQVKEVYYQRDLVRVINHNVRRVGFAILVVMVLLLVIFTALINNTIRIAIYSERFVINTMKLVGATRSFIRRPFLARSVTYGLLGGVLANAAILLLIYSYQSDFSGLFDLAQLQAIGLTIVVVLLFGALISGLSTYFAVNKFLRLRFEELYY